MATIVHFDLPADNLERAKKFYTELFGWKFNSMPGMEFPFFLIETKDLKGKIGVGGGMGQRRQPGQQVTNYVGVDSIEEYMQKVERLGGKVVMKKMAAPGFGWMAVCIDTEGNAFGLWQDDKKAK